MRGRMLLTLGLAWCLCGGAAVGQVATFDAADNPAVYGIDGGSPAFNAGGYWDVTVTGDWQGAAYDYAYGDVSGMTQITADLKGDFTGRGFGVFLVNTTNGDGAGGWGAFGFWKDVGDLPDWTTVTMDLVEAEASDVWSGVWDAVLANVDNIEMYHFGDSTSFDNIGFVPEPVSLAFFGIGALAVLIRRRR